MGLTFLGGHESGFGRSFFSHMMTNNERTLNNLASCVTGFASQLLLTPPSYKLGVHHGIAWSQ